MPYIDETRLISHLKSATDERIYFFFGEEVFLNFTYVNKLVKKHLGSEPSDFNLVKLSGEFSAQDLLEAVEGLPFFAEKKMVLIQDYDAEKASDFDEKLKILSDIPPTTIVLIYITGFTIDYKKPKAKTKKLIALAEADGIVCEFKHLSPAKTSELVIKKAAKKGIVISKNDALYLCDVLQQDLTQIGVETDKLCTFAMDKKEITRADIDRLVPKHIDTKVYALADSVVARRYDLAFSILDDLLYQRIDGVVILSVLSGAFLDYYRALVAKSQNINYNQAATEFGYAKNRAFLMSKAYSATNTMSLGHIRSCLKALYQADLQMKTTTTDTRILMEQTLVKLMGRR